MKSPEQGDRLSAQGQRNVISPKARTRRLDDSLEEIAGPMAGRRNLIELPSRDRQRLERWIRGTTTPQRLVLRSRVVLLIAGGLSGRAAADRLGISRHTADLWRSRYQQGGCDALIRDRPGRGRRRREANQSRS